MSPVRSIQPSFAGGEYSPALYARVDLAKYATGLRTCRNFFIHAAGGASNAPGTRFVAEAKTSSKLTIVRPFIFSETQAYVLEFGDLYVRFYTDRSQILDGASAYEVVTPYTEDDLALLRFESSADILYIFHPDYQTRKLIRNDDDDWDLETYAPDDGPFMLENIDEEISLSSAAVTGTAISLSSTSDIFDAEHVGALFQLTHYIEGQAASETFTGTGTGTEIRCFTTWRVISHGTWAAKIRIEKSTDGGVTWTVLRTFSGAEDYNFNTYGTEDIEVNDVPFLVRINVYEHTAGNLYIDLTTDPFYQDGIGKITNVYGTKSARWDIVQDCGSTLNTVSWSEGAWSDYRGWPSLGAFESDRLVTANTYQQPMTSWMTRIGNYESYARNPLSLLDSDGITVNLLSRQLNGINGLIPLGDLVAFTTASEWAIGSESGVLTPTTVRTKVQGYRGSSGLDPVVIGNQIIFVQSNGKVIRNLGYDDSSSSYTGIDLRILSEHLFQGYEIVDMAYQQDNDSIVWFVRNDGVLLSLTYMFEQEVIAWGWHDTDGDVESICVIPGDGYDELWMVVNRDGGRYIEYMVQRMESEDPKDQFFVHSGISYDDPLDISEISAADPCVVSTVSAHGLSDDDLVDLSDIVGMTDLNGHRFKIANKTATTFELTEEDSGDDWSTTLSSAYVSGGEVRKAYTEFGGIDHLEGQTVAILADGNVFPQDVVDGGYVTLTSAASRVHIGLPYTSDLETLNVEVGLKDGTAQGRKSKISQVTFRLINSRGGYIGPDVDNLKEAFNPTRLRLGDTPALYTGDVKESLGAGYGDGGRVFYRQTDPLPVTISAIIPTVTISPS